MGYGSVSVLRVTLRFTIDFMNGEDFGLDGGDGNTETDRDWGRDYFSNRGDGNAAAASGTKGDGGQSGDLDRQHSLSLSLTMTITIMAVNTTTLS